MVWETIDDSVEHYDLLLGIDYAVWH